MRGNRCATVWRGKIFLQQGKDPPGILGVRTLELQELREIDVNGFRGGYIRIAGYHVIPGCNGRGE